LEVFIIEEFRVQEGGRTCCPEVKKGVSFYNLCTEFYITLGLTGVVQLDNYIETAI